MNKQISLLSRDNVTIHHRRLCRCNTEPAIKCHKAALRPYIRCEGAVRSILEAARSTKTKHVVTPYHERVGTSCRQSEVHNNLMQALRALTPYRLFTGLVLASSACSPSCLQTGRLSAPAPPAQLSDGNSVTMLPLDGLGCGSPSCQAPRLHTYR